MRTRSSRRTAPAPAVDSRAPSIALPSQPDRDGMPLYRQLYRQIRDHIMAGRLAPGSRLPSARVLAADLCLSRNTVEAAVERLVAEGLVTRRVGVGTTVLDASVAAPFAAGGAVRPSVTPAIAAGSAHPPSSAAVALSSLGEALHAGGRRERDADRTHGVFATDLQRFPLRAWNRLVSRAMRTHGRRLLQVGDPQGDRDLRQAISEHAHLTRGVRCTADRVLVLGSTQQAIDLAGRLLLAPGDLALVEEPGYPGARSTLAATGATVRGIPVDADGAVVAHLEDHPTARFLYLTPSHQFPLGTTLGIARRVAALHWAAAHTAWILEDDYDSEFRYDGRPIAALQGLDACERVLYVGTFNKVLFPGLRVAYMILPTALVEPFTCARRLVDGGPPALVQAALAAFLAEGHFAAYLRRARAACAQRRDVLCAAVHQHCGGRARVVESNAGLHLVIHLSPGTDDVRIAAAAAGLGVGVAPLSRYYVDTPDQRARPRGILLSYGGAAETAIEASVRALAAAIPSASSAVSASDTGAATVN